MLEVVGLVVSDFLRGVAVACAGDEDGDVDDQVDEGFCVGFEIGDVPVRGPEVRGCMFFETRVFACVGGFKGRILVEGTVHVV